MPRAPRQFIENGIYHVISRGVKQSRIFLQDADRLDFIRLVHQTKSDEPFILHDYSLMDNHFHLLMQPTSGRLSKIMQSINSVYASRFNQRHHTSGHVLQGRFHSIPVETDAYLITVSRYIQLNAVRAGIVSRPEDYMWSNYRATISGAADPVADPRFVLGYFGADPAHQREAYRQYVEDGLARPEPVTKKVLWRMRQWGDPFKQSRKKN
jgi:putative transposase